MDKLFTTKIVEGLDGAYQDYLAAFEYCKTKDFYCEVILYNIKESVLRDELDKFFSEIKNFNKGRELDEQILPTNPFFTYGLNGCLGVHTASIDLGFYKNNKDCIALFTGWNSRVLHTDTEPQIIPGLKALSSLAMLRGTI